MGKRGRAAEALTAHKRQKIVIEAPTSEEIHTPRQLMQLVAFQQDLKKARHGLQSFKVFLDFLLSEQQVDEQLQILRDYLEASKRQDGESETTFLPEIMETWAFAVHANNDSLMSAVAVALALLLKLTLQRRELSMYGLGIGRTLLQKRQQESIGRNLSADKGKEFIISPTLRLLTEVMCLDGGTLAKTLFRARNFTFRSLARNMGMKYLGAGLEETRRPSARTNAVRFFLTALKFLHREARLELLSQKELAPALTKSLLNDPPYLIMEILDTLRDHVVKDENIPGHVKSRLLNSATLGRLATLYQYKHDTSEGKSGMTVKDAVHTFLKRTCTSIAAGVLRPQSGFYPRQVDPGALPPPSPDPDVVDPGLESIAWFNKFRDEIPVCNVTLAEFISSPSLRPHANLRQSELLLAIFEAAPELVAHYFISKRTFTFEPKISVTWIGYSAFLFKAMELPIPEFFGHKTGYARIPPPTSILIDNTILLPMNQKVLIKCLGQKAELISFVAIRLLVMATHKLQAALKMHQEARQAQGNSSSVWDESARKLMDEFCQRAPKIRDVISHYRALDHSGLLQREAASKLLRLYYEVIPQVALLAKFDVSPLLVAAIRSLEESQENPEDRVLRLLELENLLVIAGYSPGMRWFAKTQGLSVSPFVALLKVFVTKPTCLSLSGLRTCLGSVAEEHQLVQKGGGNRFPLLDVLLLLVKESENLASCEALWTLLDNSTARCATAPVRYLEMMQGLVLDGNDGFTELPTSLSPYTLALAEQLSFATSSARYEDLCVLARVVSTYMRIVRDSGNDDYRFAEVGEKIISAFSKNPLGKEILEKYSRQLNATRGLLSLRADLPPGEVEGCTEEGKKREQTNKAAISDEVLEELAFGPSFSAKDNNSALSKWATKDVDELIDGGYTANVVSLLASEHRSIRKEALSSIAKIAAKVKGSSHEEREQIWLLLLELVESCKGQIDGKSIPNTIVAFSRHALDVLKDPLHYLYGKVNSFLSKGPLWKLDKVPLVDEILREGPDIDGMYYLEVSWLASYLLDGLQGELDMTLYHNTRLFERLLSLAGNPYLRQHMKVQLLKVLYRATCIDGGSLTLITRFGVVSWLEAQSAASSQVAGGHVYRVLLKRIWDTTDKDRASIWSKGGIDDTMDERRPWPRPWPDFACSSGSN